MAQHCFNYKLKTNERYLSEMERDRPISPSNQALIRSTFKSEYFEPIRDWLLIQSDNKREKLYAFLNGKPTKRPGLKTTGRSLNLHWNPHRSVDLVAETPHTKVDFNRAIYGPLPWQLDPRAKVPTHIQTEGIFGFAEPYERRECDSGKYTELVLSILLKPHVARDLARLADDYFPLMNELLKWVEKKTMGYPIDPCQDIPTLTPKATCRIVREKMDEDQFWEPGHKPVRKAKVARDLKSRAREVRSGMSTRYRDVFCDDVHEDYLRSGSPAVTPALKQSDNSCPFGLFPALPQFKQQHYQNYLDNQQIIEDEAELIREYSLHRPAFDLSAVH
jgi:hypothetical protein